MAGMPDSSLQSPCARCVLSVRPPSLPVFTASSQVFFSVYHHHLVRSVSGLPRNGPRNLAELQASFERVLKTGLANLTVDEESLDTQRPGSPAENVAQLHPDDPRAVEFREFMRAWYSFTRVPSPSPD